MSSPFPTGSLLFFCLAIILSCSKKNASEKSETELYGISYYRGIDFPAEYVFISILNPKKDKIRVIKFWNEPQSQLSDLVSYGPQVEKNLTTWGISASKFAGADSARIRDELLRNIISNTMEITYHDSTMQTVVIGQVPYFKYIEKHRNDTIPVTFWSTY